MNDLEQQRIERMEKKIDEIHSILLGLVKSKLKKSVKKNVQKFV